MRQLRISQLSELEEVFHDDFHRELRTRIYYVLEQEIRNFDEILQELEGKLLRKYGRLEAPGYRAARVSDFPVVQHFFSCDDEQARYYLECCLDSKTYRACRDMDMLNQTVHELNAIFFDDEYAFELTPFFDTRPPTKPTKPG